MVKRFKLMFLLVFIGIFSGSLGTYAEDLLPWPWGTECPLLWEDISGEWVDREKRMQRFVFAVENSAKGNFKQVQIGHYGASGAILGLGLADIPLDKKIIEVKMYYFSTEYKPVYMGFLRTYVEDAALASGGCTKAKKVTILTLRPIDQPNQEIHFVLDKNSDM